MSTEGGWGGVEKLYRQLENNSFENPFFLLCFFDVFLSVFDVFCVFLMFFWCFSMFFVFFGVFWCFLAFFGVFDSCFGFLVFFSVGCTHFRRKLLILDDFWTILIFETNCF